MLCIQSSALAQDQAKPSPHQHGLTTLRAERDADWPRTHCSFTPWPTCRQFCPLLSPKAGGFNPGVLRMYRVVCFATGLLVISAQAEARPHAYLHRVHQFGQAVAMLPSDERVVGGRPSGCPNAFCGCEASLYRFGHIVPELNLAGNWRRFPRAAPAPGMAAVNAGHVMILQQHVAGNIWYVHDGNSGGHVTREHPRSIAGYTIVDPASGSSASPGFTTPSGFTSTAQSPSFTRPTQTSSLARPARTARFTRLAQTSPSAWKDSQVPLFAN